MAMNLVKKKFPLLTLLVALAALLLFQYKAVMPFVYKVASSDLFLFDSGDDGSREATSNAMTTEAFNQCNTYIKDELGSDVTVNLSPSAINSWGLGNFEYLINAEVSISDTNTAPVTQKYACRIQYSNGSDTTEVTNKDNWSVLGVSGIDRL